MKIHRFLPVGWKDEKKMREIAQEYSVYEQCVKEGYPRFVEVWPPHPPFLKYILLCSFIYIPPKLKF